ncbi:MAG: SLC13 family permease [Bacteroidetes bacterium]|nr:SLC13 family permease [Bacteroidota bacterium]
MNLETVIVLAGLVILVFLLAREFLRPAIGFFLLAAIFTITGIITPAEALSGFANEQIAVVIILMFVADVIKRREILDTVFNAVFSGAKTYRSFLARMMVYTSGISAFINNTPLVAIMIPQVSDWSRRHRIAPSRLFIPLSYATVLGGLITLVGTSTNLVVNGLAMEAGYPSLRIFDFAYVGIPAAVAGLIYIFFIGSRLLPVKKPVSERFYEQTREYLVETLVQPGSSLEGKTISDAGLRNLPGLYLVEILRHEQKITPVSPDENILPGDILFFAGEIRTIADLIKKFPGLSLPKTGHLPFTGKTELIETVVSTNSDLTGKKIRETGFRDKFDASVVAVHRNGERISGKIGEVVLKAGDLLLVMTGKNFHRLAAGKPDFYLLSKVGEINTEKSASKWLLVISLVTALILSSTGLLSLFKALLILVGIIALLKLVTLNEIRQGIDLNLVAVLAFSFALSKAMAHSGAAAFISGTVMDVAKMWGPVGMLAGIYIVTNLLTAFITNAAAAAITLPIAMSIVATTGLPPMPFILAVAYAATADFSTPFGYQTNLMVYGPGGYRFTDYVKIGVPLNIIYMIICLAILGFMYF